MAQILYDLVKLAWNDSNTIAIHSIIKSYLIEFGNTINVEDSDSKSALIFACSYNLTDITSLLLGAGISPNCQNTKDGYTPLMYACHHDRQAIVELLLAAGANVDKQNKNLETALIIACVRNHSLIVKMLLIVGVNLELQDDSSRTALMTACKFDLLEIAKMLVMAGANLNSQNCYLNTPLQFAIWSRSYSVCKFLLDIDSDKINLDLQNDMGNTALMLAVMRELPDVCEILIKKGANLELKNHKGETAYDLASNSIKKIFDPIPRFIIEYDTVQIERKIDYVPDKLAVEKVIDIFIASIKKIEK